MKFDYYKAPPQDIFDDIKENAIKIQGRKLDREIDYLNSVTYVPKYAKGNAGHKDCEQGVIISFNENGVRVLYSKSRTVQITNPEDLVWG